MKFLYAIFYMSATNLAFHLNTKVAKHKIHSVLPGGQFALYDKEGIVILRSN